MSLKYALRYASCIGALVLANPLQLRSSSDFASRHLQLHSTLDHLVRDLDSTSGSKKSTVPLVSRLSALALKTTSGSDGSVPSLNVTIDKDEHIQCDGASYGFDLDIVDCEEAKAEVPAGTEEHLWAERHDGWQKKILALPYRTMGDKASCYVQTVLIGNAGSARANLNQVRNAAASIRNKCASRGKLQGGIATNIGE